MSPTSYLAAPPRVEVSEVPYPRQSGFATGRHTPMRRKKQIQELEQLVRNLHEQLQATTSDSSERFGHLETIIEGRDANMDANASTIAEQSETLAALQARIAELESRTKDDTGRIDARLLEVTERVVRQLDEVSTDVDTTGALAQQTAEQTAAHAASIDGLHDAQAKLAAEQVRYDLALRAELAELAERTRRNSRS